MMGVKHKTTNISTPSGKDLKWNISITVDDTVHKSVHTVEANTEIQALQKAWVHAEKNQKKYGIKEWEHGCLSIEVCLAT